MDRGSTGMHPREKYQRETVDGRAVATPVINARRCEREGTAHRPVMAVMLKNEDDEESE